MVNLWLIIGITIANWLVVTGTCGLFVPFILRIIIIPTDEVHHFSEG